MPHAPARTQRLRRIITATAAAAATLGLPIITAAPAHGAVPAAGYAVTDFATGLPSQNNIGPLGVAFDSSDHLYAADYANSELYKFGSAGGTAASSAFSATGGAPTVGVAVTPGGHLLVGRQGVNDIAEVDQNTGAVVRSVVGVYCPTGLAIDPVSGDLFVSGASCGSSTIYRIVQPDGPSPAAQIFATPGTADGLTFGPDGNLYAAMYGQSVVKLAGPASATPGAQLASWPVPSSDGIVISGDGRYLFANRNDGNITQIDTSTGAQTNIVTGGTRGDFAAVGPDGCLYATQSDRIIKVTNADGTCSLIPTSGAPLLSLTSPNSNPTTPEAAGTPVTFDATFRNVTAAAAQNVTVSWTVTGPNAQAAVSTSNAAGTAAFTYPGVNPGTDTVTATATIGGRQLVSNPLTVTFSQPVDTAPPTFTSIPSPATGVAATATGASGAVVTYTPTATDDLGVPTVSCTPPSGSTFAVGATTVTCTATDGAGKTTTASFPVTVTYAFGSGVAGGGFAPPVDNPPALNVMTAGAAVPVKFSLGGDMGLAVLAAGSPSSVQVNCSTSAPISVVDQTVTAGSSSLSYDAATGLYAYVWKTTKTWANTCRQLDVALADGTHHTALFSFH